MGLGILMMGGWALHFASQWSRHPVVWSPDSAVVLIVVVLIAVVMMALVLIAVVLIGWF